MKDLAKVMLQKLSSLAISYKMAILIGILFSINALSTAIVASFMNADWATLDFTSRMLIIVMVVQNWTGTMLAFFNKTLARVEQGKFPIDTDLPDGGARATTTTKTNVQQTTTAVVVDTTKPNV